MSQSDSTTYGLRDAFLEVTSYIRNIKDFGKSDWIRYVSWIGTISSLFIGVMTFTMIGWLNGVEYPGYVWFIPFGAGLFTMALAVR